MKILKQGERGEAICARCQKEVDIHYEYRTVHLEETGVDVEGVLVGVCDECDGIVTVPAQSTPKLKEAREHEDEVLQANLPRQLDDVLHVIADRLDAREDYLTPALVRFYLHELGRSDRFAERVCKLSTYEIVRTGTTVRRSFRVPSDVLDAAWARARDCEIRTKTDMVRALIWAAKEDILDESSAVARRRAVRGMAASAL